MDAPTATNWALCGVLCAAAAAFALAARREPDRRGALGWAALALVALLLGLDEPFNLHRAFRGLKRVWNPGGSSAYNFLVAALLGGVVVCALLAPWLLRLPLRTRALLVCGGLLYFCGLVAGKVAGGAARLAAISQRLHLPAGGSVELLRVGLMIAGACLCIAAACLHRPRERVEIAT